MIELAYDFYYFFNSPQFLLFAICFSLSLKFYTFWFLAAQGFQSPAILKPWMLLLVVLFGSAFGDIAWLIKLVRFLADTDSLYSTLVFFIRISWGFLIIQYQALGFFMESLTAKNLRLNIWRKLLLLVSCIFCGYFFFIAFFEDRLVDYSLRSHAMSLSMALAPLEVRMFRYTIFYLINLITIPSLFLSIQRITKRILPKILARQLKIFMTWFMIPYLFVDILIAMHHSFIWLHQYTYIVVGISSILFSWAAYYCLRRVVKFRFLNAESCVQSTQYNVAFIDGFKDVLAKLGQATTEYELAQIIQEFFQETFAVSPQRVNLYLRSIHEEVDHAYHTAEQCKTERIVESFISTHDASSDLYRFVGTHKIIIGDEIEFNNFYENSALGALILQALDAISADVFLPVYYRETMIAYIIIERQVWSQKFFGNRERDQMVVFASYLSNIINLLQNRNLETLLQQEKELREELHNKKQELYQYRECVNSFLRRNRSRDIGIIFYKGRRFIVGNQAAKEMVGVNLNAQDGHPMVKALKHIVHQVLEYGVSYSVSALDSTGNKLLILGTPNLGNNDVIITIRHPEIADIVKQKLHLLNDPTKMDYLLYLETTESGKLIEQLIPGSGEILLNFKIELFKMALHRKVLLLNIPEDDLTPMVEILHHISLREYLHILNLQPSSDSLDIATKLFGLNPILGISTASQPLLEKLNGVGTLFINNIHFLSLEVQEYLAEFIKFGMYKIFRSDQRVSADVRIICATNQNLSALVKDLKFSANLFNELKDTTLQMPSLPMLPEHEFTDLAEGFFDQSIKLNSFRSILELTDRERERLIRTRPISLYELRLKVQQLILYKSKKTSIHQELQFTPACDVDISDLEHIARLGKKALRDQKAMALLWDRFKNQAQIAAFLGVNRSSVNRRCKDYHLL